MQHKDQENLINYLALKHCLFLPNEESSQALAAFLANFISLPCLLLFQGEIGAGKTSFIRALGHSLGIKTAMKSPTFALVESYAMNKGYLHHFDLYRLQGEDDLDALGFRDYLQADTLCCIEWPERALSLLENKDLAFHFHIEKEGRLMTVQAFTKNGEYLLDQIKKFKLAP